MRRGYTIYNYIYQMEPKQKNRSKQDIFELKKCIGAGSFGQVEKCKNKIDNKTYAVKIISGISELFLESIEKEAQAMKTAHSDFTMELIDHFYDQQYQNGSYIFVMPFYKKGNLAQIMKNEWKQDQILLFLYQMASAFLAVPQGQGYWHLDLKPDNILIKNEGQYIICDFGCAKLVENNGVSQYLRISINKGGGTTDYASPELIMNYEGSKYSDMWSLGIILYEILYHKHPLRQGKSSMINEITQFKDGVRKISYPKIEGMEKIISLCKDMLQPKRRLEWQALKQYIYEAISVPQRVPIIVSIDKFIEYISNISTIVFGLLYYLKKNEKNLFKLKLQKQLDRLISSAKLFNYILCAKSQQAILAEDFKNTHAFYLFEQTKKNKTIHQKQKLSHIINSVKNYSAEVLQQSNLDDMLSAKNGFLDEMDDLMMALGQTQHEPFHPMLEWEKVEKIYKFVKGKTKNHWNLDYHNKEIIKNLAHDLINL